MRPKIFIASSKEGEAIGAALKFNLKDHGNCTLWSDPLVFTLSGTTIDSLIEKFHEHDFGIFVFSPDDIAKIRLANVTIPRDNVVFESGLFMGMYGKDRSFIIMPQDVIDLRTLTDLYGFTTGRYDSNLAMTDSGHALGPASKEIINAIEKSTWYKLRLAFRSESSLGVASLTYPLKLRTRITNPKPTPVIIESISFTIMPPYKFAMNAKVHNGVYIPEFLIHKDPESVKDIYKRSCFLKGEETIEMWVPIDKSISKPDLDRGIRNKEIGIWNYRCFFLRDQLTVANYTQEF